MVVLTGFEPVLSDFLTSPLFSDYKVTPKWKRRTRVSDTRELSSPSVSESGTMPQSPTCLTATLQDSFESQRHDSNMDSSDYESDALPFSYVGSP